MKKLILLAGIIPCLILAVSAQIQATTPECKEYYDYLEKIAENPGSGNHETLEEKCEACLKSEGSSVEMCKHPPPE